MIYEVNIRYEDVLWTEVYKLGLSLQKGFEGRNHEYFLIINENKRIRRVLKQNLTWCYNTNMEERHL